VSDKPKIPHAQAVKLAIELVDMMLPYVQRIVVAGSLRREKEFVGDIELLYIPKLATERVGLFEGDVQKVDLTENFLVKLLRDGVLKKRPSKIGTLTWGPSNKLGRHVASNIPVDFFSTTAANWWVSLVIRTGSKETNLMLTNGAIKLGRTLNAYGAGVTCSDESVIPAQSERHVFQLCDVPYREPKDR
jgi:DNA polymerase/3'-5' exonuclease PolX